VQIFQEWVGIHLKNAPFSPADQEHVNTVQVVEMVLENHQDTIQNLSIALE
jgi:hypothetical protein